MPSPVGHTIAGLTVHVLAARGDAELASAPRLGIVLAAALAPDLDLLLRFVDGQNHHQQHSHSVGFAVLAAVLVWVVSRARHWPKPGALALLTCAAWLSHLVLDYFSSDTHPPIGLMALWPLSSDYYKFPFPVFLDIGRELDWDAVTNNAVAAAWEIVVLSPLFTLAWRWRQRRERQ